MHSKAVMGRWFIGGAAAIAAMAAALSVHGCGRSLAPSPPDASAPAPPGGSGVPGAEHCAPFVKALLPDLMVPLSPGERPACSVALSLEAPRVFALVVPRLPSPEGEWTAARVVVAAGDRWYATPVMGSLVLSVTRLEAGPGEGYFHFVTRSRGLELGAGAIESEDLHVCRVLGAGVPRCAQRTVGGKFEPYPRDPDEAAEDWAPADAPEDWPEDWKVPWSITSDGIRFEAVTGKIAPETERAAEGTVSLDALLASGDDLEPE